MTNRQLTLLDEGAVEAVGGHERSAPSPRLRLIETERFPFEEISRIAEAESWRKEVARPTYHIHKWWAQRLGSVFRAAILGVFLPEDADLCKKFYEPVRLSGQIIYEPFMGSGTTVGEALKLGARVIGRDINPVACFSVKNALRLPNSEALWAEFRAIDKDVGNALRTRYQTILPDGRAGTTLYVFWVKQVPCPKCSADVDLFSSYIFAQHAYPKRFPNAQAVCPNCGGINSCRYDSRELTCRHCARLFQIHGPAGKTHAVCPACKESFSIKERVNSVEHPPLHRMYAKLVASATGDKQYLPITQLDRDAYAIAASELAVRRNAVPIVALADGHNTRQALNYRYRSWHEMFNARQLLCLSILAERIASIQDEKLRDAFCCLFSGALEFNNMFASFKGEGTGAVRHMFSHHILKPERTPLEANLWGTPWSSGSFSGLFESRLIRAAEYASRPFELQLDGKGGKVKKVYGLSCSPVAEPSSDYPTFCESGSAYISCGDSAHIDAPDESVDAVVTDPPFFDNVHYSELADFFYVWQQHILGGNLSDRPSTRSLNEVQHTDAGEFMNRLTGVFRECQRVLKRDGLMLFSYHHSRNEGWETLLEALMRAEFVVTAVQPVKAEMAGAAPKRAAKEPIDIDVLVVCRKRGTITFDRTDIQSILGVAGAAAEAQAVRLSKVKDNLSKNDLRVILLSQLMLLLSRDSSTKESVERLCGYSLEVSALVERIAEKVGVAHLSKAAQ